MTEYLPDCCNRVTVLLEYLDLTQKSHCLYRCLIRYIMSNGLLPLPHCIAIDFTEQSLDGISYTEASYVSLSLQEMIYTVAHPFYCSYAWISSYEAATTV